MCEGNFLIGKRWHKFKKEEAVCKKQPGKYVGKETFGKCMVRANIDFLDYSTDPIKNMGISYGWMQKPRYTGTYSSF